MLGPIVSESNSDDWHSEVLVAINFTGSKAYATALSRLIGLGYSADLASQLIGASHESR